MVQPLKLLDVGRRFKCIISALFYESYFTAGTQRWDATGAMQKLVVAYDNLADKFSPEIEFRGRIAKGATFSKIVTIPFNPEHTEIFGIAIYFGRDMLGLNQFNRSIARYVKMGHCW